MHYVQKFEDCCAVVGDCGGTVGDHLVHAAGAQGRADHFNYGCASVYVRNYLGAPLGIVGAFTEKQDTGLLKLFRDLRACLTSFI